MPTIIVSSSNAPIFDRVRSTLQAAGCVRMTDYSQDEALFRCDDLPSLRKHARRSNLRMNRGRSTGDVPKELRDAYHLFAPSPEYIEARTLLEELLTEGRKQGYRRTVVRRSIYLVLGDEINRNPELSDLRRSIYTIVQTMCSFDMLPRAGVTQPQTGTHIGLARKLSPFIARRINIPENDRIRAPRVTASVVFFRTMEILTKQYAFHPDDCRAAIGRWAMNMRPDMDLYPTTLDSLAMDADLFPTRPRTFAETRDVPRMRDAIYAHIGAFELLRP